MIIFRGRDKERSVQLNQKRMVIGRGEDADIRVDNPLVSRAHAIVSFTEGRWVIEDLDSPNGLYLNGKRTKLSPLTVGDRIELGRHVLIFEGSGDSEFDVQTTRNTPTRERSSSEDTAILTPLDVEDIQRRVRQRMRMHVVLLWDRERQEVHLEREEYLVGYSDRCTLRLPGKAVFGKEVALLTRDGDTYSLQALSSVNKVRVNDKRVQFRALRNGDRIRIRNVTIQFHQPVGRKPSGEDS
jgi:pSer/pThr/pTyr-binding forkhead associated (FHA) protein